METIENGMITSIGERFVGISYSNGGYSLIEKEKLPSDIKVGDIVTVTLEIVVKDVKLVER